MSSPTTFRTVREADPRVRCGKTPVGLKGGWGLEARSGEVDPCKRWVPAGCFAWLA
jgi:hypothetical protein